MIPRRRFTEKEEAAKKAEQRGLCACGCGESLDSGPYDGEHTIPHYFRNEDEDYDGKPDALMLRGHHKPKTADDVKAIAKVKRLRGETGKRKPGAKRRPKMKSRGFASAEERRARRERFLKARQETKAVRE